MTSENEREEHDHEHEDREDERIRALLADEGPDFPATRSLGDRALASAARRRARSRAAFGGAGAVAVVAVGAVAVGPLAGWGGHAPKKATAVTPTKSAAPPTATASLPTLTPTHAPQPTPSSSEPSSPSAPSPSTPSLPAPPPTSIPATPTSHPSFVYTAKMKVVDRVMNTLQSGGHDNSFMGVGLTGQDYTNGTDDPASAYDSSPIIVYRKPVSDPTLERDAINAAAPYAVVFKDSVLDASEQWYLGHRIEQDMDYWKQQGVEFGTALQQNGTITIDSPEPDKVVPLLEQHYGYDGRVFVGHYMVFNHVPPPTPGSTGG